MRCIGGHAGERGCVSGGWGPPSRNKRNTHAPRHVIACLRLLCGLHMKAARRGCASTAAATLRWVDDAIIGLNLCPYTKAVRNRASALRCRVCTITNDDLLLGELDDEAAVLAAGGGPETSLLVIPPTTPYGRALNDDFGKFMSLGWKVEDRLAELAPTTLPLQLAMFHPLALRNMYSMGDEDAADYATRAPFPTLHLLRTADVEAVPPKSAVRRRMSLYGARVQRTSASARTSKSAGAAARAFARVVAA